MMEESCPWQASYPQQSVYKEDTTQGNRLARVNPSTQVGLPGGKVSHFYSLPFGQAEANIYQPKHHFNQPQKRFDEQIDFTVLLLFEFLKKLHLPVGQVNNRIHQPNSKIHQPRAIRHYFLCTLGYPQANVRVTLPVL